MTDTHTHDPLRPHSHDPHPEPPSADASFELHLPDGTVRPFTPEDLRRLPPVTVPGCFIVSTGHGTSGPFAFTGVRLDVLVRHCWSGAWDQAEVISGDGFGTRISRQEAEAITDRPILLAHTADGQPLTRSAGLVRLIVPSEADDALRQVKWIGHVRVANTNITQSRREAEAQR